MKLLFWAFLGLACWLFMPVYPIWVLWLLLGFYLVLGAISCFRLKKAKRSSEVICLLMVIGICFFCLLFNQNILSRKYYDINTGHYNMQCIRQALFNYVKTNHGCFPPAKTWCDELLRTNSNLSQKHFLIPRIKNRECNFAYNANLEGLRCDSVPLSTVVIFMSEGDWNMAGGKELLYELRSINTYVLLADGTIERCVFPELAITRWNEENKETYLQPLEWESK